jgi:hypothetical protein
MADFQSNYYTAIAVTRKTKVSWKYVEYICAYIKKYRPDKIITTYGQLPKVRQNLLESGETELRQQNIEIKQMHFLKRNHRECA